MRFGALAALRAATWAIVYNRDTYPFRDTRIGMGAEEGGKPVPVVRATWNEIQLLARLMRAEAESEGRLGMLLVGNVAVNRLRGNCLDFRNIRTLTQVIFQSPGGFEAVRKGYFYQRARWSEIQLAQRVVNGERFWPATYSLWFFKPWGGCPPRWYGQWNAGRYKSHCFYHPTYASCPGVYKR